MPRALLFFHHDVLPKENTIRNAAEDGMHGSSKTHIPVNFHIVCAAIFETMVQRVVSVSGRCGVYVVWGLRLGSFVDFVSISKFLAVGGNRFLEKNTNNRERSTGFASPCKHCQCHLIYLNLF